jgi:hypothetical protein
VIEDKEADDEDDEGSEWLLLLREDLLSTLALDDEVEHMVLDVI